MKQERPQQKKKERERDGNELDHNHQHFKYRSLSLERLIHMVKFLTFVLGSPFQILPGTWATCNDVFRVFLRPSRKKRPHSRRTTRWVTTATFHKLSQSLFTNHPTTHILWQSEKSIRIHKLRKPKTLSFISCKRRHYSNCTYVAIFLNNNSVGYMIKLVHKITGKIRWIRFSKPFVNWDLNHAF